MELVIYTVMLAAVIQPGEIYAVHITVTSQDDSSQCSNFYGLDDQGIGVRFCAGARDVSLLNVKIGPGATQSPIQRVLAAVFMGERGTSMKLTTHYHLVLRLRIVELYLHSPIRLRGVVIN
jgi:hypothetical protein